MTSADFNASLSLDTPPADLPVTLQALWWDAKGDWGRAHSLVDDLSTPEGMGVHAYLHRKEGNAWNADYWYQRAGSEYRRPELDAEWNALVEGMLSRQEVRPR
jgi:hypothetical protein